MSTLNACGHLIAAVDSAETVRSPATFIARLKDFLSRAQAPHSYDSIGDLIARNGSVLTDDLERRIARELMR